jgi:hypothetical protein
MVGADLGAQDGRFLGSSRERQRIKKGGHDNPNRHT